MRRRLFFSALATAPVAGSFAQMGIEGADAIEDSDNRLPANSVTVLSPPTEGFAQFHASVGGEANPHMYIGYNTLPNAVLSNPDDRGAVIGIEANYEPQPGVFWQEMYWQYNFQSGFTGEDCRRPIMAVIDKATNLPVVLQLGGGPVSGVSLNVMDGTGTDQQKIVGKQKAQVTPSRFTVFGEAGQPAPSLNVISNPGSETGVEISTGDAKGGARISASSTAESEALYLQSKGDAPVVIQSGDGNQWFAFAGAFLDINAAPGTYPGIQIAQQGAAKWRLYNDFETDRLVLLNGSATAGVYMEPDGSSWLAASDRRLPYKKTAKTFSVLDKLDKFDIYEFERPGGEKEIGPMAQDLHKAFPALVREGDNDSDRELAGLSDPGIWSIRADRAGFVGLAGLKEVVTELKQLREELRLAREEITALKAKLPT